MAAISAAACTSTEYVDVEAIEPVMVVNAQMSTSEASHCIHLSTSTRSLIHGVDDANVTVTVNSSAPIAAVQDTEEGSGAKYNSTRYWFNAVLKSGDVVTVKAVKGTLSGEATIEVPDEPILGEVTMKDAPNHTPSDSYYEYGVYDPSYDPETSEYCEWHLLEVNLTDIPSKDNHYRIGIFVEETINSPEQGLQRYFVRLSADTSSEPVLSGNKASGGDLLESLSEDSNHYSLFTDGLFKDKSYTLKLYLSERMLTYYRKYQTDYHWDSEKETYVADPVPEGVVYDSKILVRLSSISLDQYIYLKALGLDDYGILFSEPISIPSNVTGGLGFVNIESCKEYRIQLSE